MSPLIWRLAMTSNDITNEINNSTVDSLLNQQFAGKVVRKDLTKMVKEGANVPVYVLEYLLGKIGRAHV